MPSKPVTIVVPVYADWSSLKTCIKSLKQTVSENDKVILVNDCGPQAVVLRKKIKKAINKQINFEYFHNPGNLGFIKTCNRAVFELDNTANDILLLNSDTQVTPGFLEEMQSIFTADKDIGAVSPRSNNATIATIPLSSALQKGINPNKAFKIWREIKNKLPRYNEVPVAHGFCLLIRRSVINKYGLFDEVFGKGYGEENDFCLRIKKQGFKSVLANRAFVFHLEARSFTLEAKSKLLEKNSKILYKRYPNYRQSVRDYMKEALVREAKAERAAGVKINSGPKAKIKSLIKRNKKAHQLAKKTRDKIRN